MGRVNELPSETPGECCASNTATRQSGELVEDCLTCHCRRGPSLPRLQPAPVRFKVSRSRSAAPLMRKSMEQSLTKKRQTVSLDGSSAHRISISRSLVLRPCLTERPRNLIDIIVSQRIGR